ncbi:MAG: hypothetical protein HY876_00810 [Coriobacteriales bacterium]|nr:hypothetical protein [Coriobacteriales bacterium]
MSLEELKKKAEDVRNLAVAEASDRIEDIRDNRMTTAALIGVGVVVGLASLAYFIGSNAGRSRAQRQFDRMIKDPCGPFGPFGKDIERG